MHASQALASSERRIYQVPNPSVAKNKKLLRKRLREIVVSDPMAASRRIVANLATILQQHPEWQCIALFVALPSEPDLSALPNLFPGRRFVYPRVEEERMTFHDVNDPARDMISGPWGLREPSPTSPIVPREDIAVMICPGMAFSIDGRRLGKGRGFYDRYLEGYGSQRPYCIGVCFSDFLLEDLPHETHDIRMDRAICDDLTK